MYTEYMQIRKYQTHEDPDAHIARSMKYMGHEVQGTRSASDMLA
jgi:hypothetical protein